MYTICWGFFVTIIAKPIFEFAFREHFKISAFGKMIIKLIGMMIMQFKSGDKLFESSTHWFFCSKFFYVIHFFSAEIKTLFNHLNNIILIFTI